MSKGAKKEYNFREKNSWRRWQWKKIKRKIMSYGIYPKDAVVLYLAGEKNYDWPAARHCGFKYKNMIACEINKNATKELRTKKVNVVNCGLSDAILYWGNTIRIDVIVADFCGGFTKDLHNFTMSLFGSKGISYNCVLSINLLRGRDPMINYVYAHEDHKKYAKLFNIPPIHRGGIFMILLFSQLMRLLIDAHEQIGRELQNPQGILNYFVDNIIPNFNSYKSKKQVFDSCIVDIGWISKMIRDRSGEHGVELDASLASSNFKNVCAKTAAAKAIRTMRINGQLPTPTF